MVSSFNVEAVAANSVALQHYGQKVVYGHVMTNSGKRILVQITFGVMSVRKPLLSTSSLKHRGVTIIFNHDYDRIICRLETVNLVSHDCHSYMHVILTNGILPCKVLVMAGENATNDVDEEVHDNDGAERNEAREASAGDRRAIADADQAGQLDISGEAKTAREYYGLLNRRQMLREWHTTRHMFHSEIGVQSVLRVVDEVLRTDELW